MIIGLLGGSFNPPHRGHLALAATVLDRGLVDRVALIPAAVPPHKAVPHEADAPTRAAMARLLAAEDDRIEVDDLELTRPGPSFTVDTVRQLRADHPGTSYRLIIGSDMARIFASWREYGELLRTAPPLVAERPDCALSDDPDAGSPGLTPSEAAVLRQGRFPMAPVAISSTLVRSRLAAGADDEEMLRYLTRPVLEYIRHRGLYRRE